MYNKIWKNIMKTRDKVGAVVMLAAVFCSILAPIEPARAETVPEGYIAIASPKDLANIANDTTADYYLTKDIDMKSYGEWQPLKSFSGTLDGNNHSISNLTITDSGSGEIGLFASIEGTSEEAVVSNLSMKKVVIKTKDATEVGAIAGWVRNARIESCYVSGTIESTGESVNNLCVGGIAGSIGSNTVISECVNTADVLGSFNKSSTDGSYRPITVYSQARCYAGGIVGQLSHNLDAVEATIKISECYNKGKIVANVVTSANATAFYSQAKATAEAYAYTGGICGGEMLASQGNMTKINNSFNTGTVGSYAMATAKTAYIAYRDRYQISKMESAVGGIAGYLSGAEIENVYSSGKVELNGNCGGIIGKMDSAVSLENCYFLSDKKKDINAILGGAGNIEVGGWKALGSDGMKKESNYTDWDFKQTWVRNSAVNNGYPVLSFSTPLFQLAKPTVSVKAGTYRKKIALKLQSTAEGAVIYYTTDGTVPTAASKKYTKPISISKSTTVKAIVVCGNFKNSPVTTAKYVVK